MERAPVPLLTWVNHASFIVKFGDVCLLTDPWIDGTAFNNGWLLVSKSAFLTEDFESITHIWFSHEHPDHFAPATLKQIAPQTRANIRVLYQHTLDKRVIHFCSQLGFQTQELLPGIEYMLGDRMKVRCNTVGPDSWLLIQAGDFRLLNLNDCILRNQTKIGELAELIGPIDVLLTQFSYAGWVGNPDRPDLRRAAAVEKLEIMLRQVAGLKPRAVIPFASFVWFSNRDNFYMNEGANPIDYVRKFLEARGVEALVFYPGDEWTPWSEHDSALSVAKYSADSAESMLNGCSVSSPVSLEELIAAGRSCMSRLEDKNWLFWLWPLAWLGILQPAIIALSDYDVYFKFDVLDGFKQIALRNEATADISMASDSLMFVLKNEFGSDTLIVNGRFIEKRSGGLLRFSRQFAVARFNSHGMTVPMMFFGRAFWRRRTYA